MTIDITKRSERNIFILTLGALTMLGPMAVDLYLPALPAIARAMGEPLSQIQYTLSAYIAGFGVGQLICGPLSDRWGRQKVLFFGLIFFIITNIMAAFCTTSLQLMMVRVLQAIAGAAIVVTIPAMVRDLFPKEESARALSSILMVMTLAPLVAPLLGGQLLKWFYWQALFIFLAVLGGLIFVLTIFHLKETLPARLRVRLTAREVLGSYLDVLSNREAMGCILCHGFFFGGMFAFISGSPFVYIELFGVPAENYGFLFGANIVALALMNMVNIQLIGRFLLFNILRCGSLLAAFFALTLLFNAVTGMGDLLGIVLPIVFYVGCMSLTGPSSNALALAHFPNTAGTANAVAGTVRFSIGGLSSLAVGYFHDGTAITMAAVMAVCGILSVASLLMVNNKGLTQDELFEFEAEAEKALPKQELST